MQKTINSNIGGRIFHVEDDAYALLDQYLKDVKTHFSSYPDQDEIMADIEHRIAEQFESLSRGKDGIIAKADVAQVMEIMGQPQDFSDDTNSADEPKTSKQSEPRKRVRLYRNTDNQIIAGVASGIAAYFDIDPLWIRLIFVVTLLFGGSGILIYIILWIIVPAAGTPAEKVEMRGNTVTLASIEKTIKEEILDNEKAKAGVEKVGGSVRKIGMAFGKIVRMFFKIIIQLIGVFMSIGFAIACFGLLVATIVALRTGNSPYVDFPLRDFFTHAELYTVLFAGFFTAVIPLAILGLIGGTLAAFRNIFNKQITIAMIVVWFVASAILVSTIVNAAPRFEQFRNTHPAYKIETRTLDLKDFNKLSFSDGLRVEIKQGVEYKIEVAAVHADQERIAAEVKDSTLSMRMNSQNNRICIFCIHQGPRIIVTLPELNELSGEDGISISADTINTPSLVIRSKNGSRVEINHLTAAAVQSESSDGSHLILSGTTTDYTASAINGARVQARGLIAQNVTATGKDGSWISVHAESSLKTSSKNGSRIDYEGSPETIEGNAREDSGSDDYKDYDAPAAPYAPAE